MRTIPLASFIVALVLWSPVPLLAQQGTAQIGGKITDEQGAILPGVNVVVTNEATNFSGGKCKDVDEGVNVSVGGTRQSANVSCEIMSLGRRGFGAHPWVVVGEGPGATEDAQGRPFVGQAGNLLNGILEAIEVPRDSVYITNIVKCRPPQNRKPLPDEIAACIPYLHRQIEIVQPKVILALGSTAAEAMLGVRKSLGELRGKVHTYNGIPLVVTYHPAALLRNPNWKKPTWDDVRIARQLLDR